MVEEKLYYNRLIDGDDVKLASAEGHVYDPNNLVKGSRSLLLFGHDDRLIGHAIVYLKDGKAKAKCWFDYYTPERFLIGIGESLYLTMVESGNIKLTMDKVPVSKVEATASDLD